MRVSVIAMERTEPRMWLLHGQLVGIDQRGVRTELWSDTGRVLGP